MPSTASSTAYQRGQRRVADVDGEGERDVGDDRQRQQRADRDREMAVLAARGLVRALEHRDRERREQHVDAEHVARAPHDATVMPQPSAIATAGVNASR